MLAVCAVIVRGSGFPRRGATKGCCSEIIAQHRLADTASLFSWECQRIFKPHKNPTAARTILFGIMW